MTFVSFRSKGVCEKYLKARYYCKSEPQGY